MASAPLRDIVRFCNRILRTSQVNDYDGAVNGLQAENRGRVTRLAAAVDASIATIKKAVALRVDFFVVHHGLFWNNRHPWTGKNYEILQLLLENDLAIY